MGETTVKKKSSMKSAVTMRDTSAISSAQLSPGYLHVTPNQRHSSVAGGAVGLETQL